MGNDWFSPGAVKFTRRQVLWLVQNLGSLREGRWPPEASSYIDIPTGKRNVSRRAPFSTPIEYAAEITDRAEKCGEDGLILIAIECWGETLQSMSRYLKRPEWSINKRRKRALAYVASGPARRWHNTRKRKAQSYEEFKERKR